MGRRFGVVGWTVTVLLVSAATAAWAEPRFLAQNRVPRRQGGAGTAIGGGVAGATTVSSTGSKSSGVGFSLLGPTLEVRFFNRWGHSIDISIPVTNIVIVSVVNEGFFWITSAYYNFNIGSGSVRFLLGPGLGFSVGAWSGLTAGGIRLPAVLGVEFNTRARGFGFQLMTRPWVDFAFGEVSQGVGGGAMLELGFIWYATR